MPSSEIEIRDSIHNNLCCKCDQNLDFDLKINFPKFGEDLWTFR